ncbi:MAG: hypothetical protein AB1797_01235 [bacterium]
MLDAGCSMLGKDSVSSIEDRISSIEDGLVAAGGRAMRSLFTFLTAAFLFQASCSPVNTVTITKEVSPQIDSKQIKRTAIISFTAEETNKDIGGVIENIFRGEIAPHTSFYILNSYEVQNLSEGAEVSETVITNEAKAIELAERLNIDILLFLKIDDFEVEERHDFVLKDRYLPSEQRYQFYRVDYLELSNQLKMKVYLLSGSSGHILWEKEYTQVESKRTLARDESPREEYDGDLLKALLKPSITDFMALISSRKRAYKRHLVLE